MARAFHIHQTSRSVQGRGDGMSAESPREFPAAAAICFWAALSWVLAGLVVAGIWRVVT